LLSERLRAAKTIWHAWRPTRCRRAHAWAKRWSRAICRPMRATPDAGKAATDKQRRGCSVILQI